MVVDAAVTWGMRSAEWTVGGGFGATMSTTINPTCSTVAETSTPSDIEPASTTWADITFSYPVLSSDTCVSPACTPKYSTFATGVDSSPCTSDISSSSYTPSNAISAPSYLLPSFASGSDSYSATSLVSPLTGTQSTYTQVSLTPTATCTSGVSGSGCPEGPDCSHNTTITISITSTSYVTTTVHSSFPSNSPGGPATHSVSTSESCQSTTTDGGNATGTIVISTSVTSGQQSDSGLGYPTPNPPLITLTSAGSATLSSSSAYGNSGYGSSISTSDTGASITITGPVTQSQSPSPPLTFTSHSITSYTTSTGIGTTITTLTSRSTSTGTGTSTNLLPSQTGGAGELALPFEGLDMATVLFVSGWILVLGL
ncbi:hypothetical protein Z517_02159 [Fonsecaea pedrosoi CBS 271.37]|uniref:Uncharacterized protein n=1 Tax=Fonsecaea pedrosoi CBS 271.37 TaxID=1442368 RepID=A0A0D2DYS0_9EURO|nr:uncharacterized protein Z517_02159 [Fonsecaea pedrosoi CBS 271.37]KIW82916.1 hypothetical protein Z517_02159 [Fonsecaea pedrosoi CBS 271.37]